VWAAALTLVNSASAGKGTTAAQLTNSGPAV